MPDTAVLSVHDAIGRAIDQGANPPQGPNGAQLLASPRFYRGTAPAVAVNTLITNGLGYFIFGQVSETDSGFYAQPGETGRYRIHCWHNTPANASRMYQWLKGLISDRILMLDGHTMVRGNLSRITDQGDTDGKAWQVIGDYNVESLEG